MKDKRQILILSLLVLGIVLITTGTTYAIFKYGQLGQTDSTVTVGSIVFHYNEQMNKGRGISLPDALPMSDNQGKLLTGQGNYFDFEITSKTQSKIEVPYTVTAKISSDSTLNPNVVKLYLSDQSDVEIESPRYFTEPYNSTGKTWLQAYNENQEERIVYQGTVPENSSNYHKDFRVRIWIDENTNFAKQCTNPEYITESACIAAGEEWTYLYNDKTFSITFNVYATGENKDDEEQVEVITCPSNKCVYAFPVFSLSTTTYNDEINYVYDNDQWWYSGDSHPVVTNYYGETISSETHQRTILQPTDYKTNYEDVISETGKNYFVAMILDNDNKISRAFVCYKDENVTCYEGANNGESGIMVPVYQTLSTSPNIILNGGGDKDTRRGTYVIVENSSYSCSVNGTAVGCYQ